MTSKNLKIVLVLFCGLIVSISASASETNVSSSFDEAAELDAENQELSFEEEDFLAKNLSDEESQEKGSLYTYCYKNPGYCTAVVVGTAVALIGVSLAGSNYLNGDSSDTSSTASVVPVPVPGQEDYDVFRANIKETHAAKGKAFEALDGDSSLQYLKGFNVPNLNVNPMNRLFTGKYRIRGMSLTPEGNLSIITKFAGENREQIFARP